MLDGVFFFDLVPVVFVFVVVVVVHEDLLLFDLDRQFMLILFFGGVAWTAFLTLYLLIESGGVVFLFH